MVTKVKEQYLLEDYEIQIYKKNFKSRHDIPKVNRKKNKAIEKLKPKDQLNKEVESFPKLINNNKQRDHLESLIYIPNKEIEEGKIREEDMDNKECPIGNPSPCQEDIQDNITKQVENKENI